MKKLHLKYFKAFKNELILELEDKNLLVYGENGSGKSSIYEAFKIIFYKEKIESNIPRAPTQEEQAQLDNDYWDKFNNKNTNKKFEILIEDSEYPNFPKDDYQAFLISIDEIDIDNKIRLDALLNKHYFNIDDIPKFCKENYSYIEQEVNQLLSKYNESIEIEIDEQDDYTLKIVDNIRGLEAKNELRSYFNEAKLNLVLLLVLFNSIRYARDDAKQHFLLLDDFITSLDISNRSFLMSYVIKEFSNFQIIILTHNVNFYNLIKYIVNEISDQSEKWNFGNLFELNNDNKFFLKKSIEKASEIRSFYQSTPEEIEEVGNKIRKRFEVLLYEYSKLLMIGAVEDSRKILERIESQRSLYFRNNRTASDLVDELFSSLNSGIDHNLKNRLIKKINDYRQTDFDNLKGVLNSLKLYKKITMHPMSHGTIGQTAFTTREIENSLDLLEKLEKYLKDLVDSNIAGI